MATPKFSKITQSFYSDLKTRVNSYFEEVKMSPTGNFQLFFKAVILLVVFALVYAHLVFFTPSIVLAICECVFLGGLVAAIGFNVMHDGAHGSFSKYKSINTFASFSLNILGGSSYMWNMKHNIIHHTYTNVEGVDDDIEIQPWMRMSDSQKKHWMHKYQHLYFWIFYSILYISWMFVTDYMKYFKGKIGEIKITKMKFSDHLVFWGFKAVHLVLFIGLPIYMLGFTNWLIGFLALTIFAGLILSIVFQLAHTVEHTAFVMPDGETGNIEDEWAKHQVKTTANFATHNKLISWLVGGLNFQIEHHLFPKISHIHYPAISKIIKQVCKEYGLVYNEYPRMRYALVSHISYLKHMGR
ncbi:MAG: acyl-CoA desaturase [Chitinophagaceae bacterium]|nr:MAG: acyl-CoA desaturase [Chitinophagaceae bacterium]